MNCNIRVAKRSDLEKLFEFEQGVITAERPFDQSLKNSKITYYDLENLILSDNAQVVVAECDGGLIGSGYASLKIAEPFEKFDRYSYLGFMFVVHEHRGKGINKSIIDSLIQWSKSKGVFEIRLDVFEENIPAVSAYSKLGFKKVLVNMRMDVS